LFLLLSDSLACKQLVGERLLPVLTLIENRPKASDTKLVISPAAFTQLNPEFYHKSLTSTRKLVDFRITDLSEKSVHRAEFDNSNYLFTIRLSNIHSNNGINPAVYTSSGSSHKSGAASGGK
jgi:hypothetical protein